MTAAGRGPRARPGQVRATGRYHCVFHFLIPLPDQDTRLDLHFGLGWVGFSFSEWCLDCRVLFSQKSIGNREKQKSHLPTYHVFRWEETR
jgi:hypothetical protein